MTYLCVPIFVQSTAQAHRDATLAAEAGATMIEYRLDAITDIVVVEQLVSATNIPSIATCRSTRQGGTCDLPSVIRNAFTLAALAKGATFGDMEFDDVDESALSEDGRYIFSIHDFAGRPERLSNVLLDLNSSSADVVKIAWLARSIRDNIEAFEILQQRQKPTIALCMGEAGLISRVLAKKFGAFLTFASLRDESATAPGQVTIHDMKHLYRWDALKPSTRVFGVVGCPVAHSMSPAVHNAAFEATGFDGVYLPMLVNPGYESFKAFMESFVHFAPLHLSGLSVTIPHKENALRYLLEKGATVDDLATRVGAVNTITVNGTTLFGFNTDHDAILDSLTAKLKCTREALADKRVAVIGAGGTGRTAVAALAAYGATVVVYNRTKERADELAAAFDGQTGRVVSARLDKLCDSCCHIFINTTPVGMHPKVDESPLGERVPNFTDETLVFDTIYNPIKTKLLQQAEQAGAQTLGGIEMFVHQAASQFERWTGSKAPRDAMRQAMERHLGTS